MTGKLFVQAISKYILGAVLVGALVFLPAGSTEFWQGWLFMGILFIPMFFAGIAMMLKNPALLKERLDAREERGAQRAVIALSGLMFLLGFAAAGLNYRFAWPMLPAGISIAAAALFLLAYILYAEVLRENTYLSRSIKVQEGQKVIDTGLYGIVRHPMYSATLILFLAIPLVLGSWIGFAVMLAFVPVLAVRILKEESCLRKELDGYTAYCKKVRYRLMPYIW